MQLDILQNTFTDHTHAVADKIGNPTRSHTDGGYTHDEGDSREAFKPSGIGQLTMVLVLYGAKQQLADNPQNINRGDHDRSTSHNSQYPMEGIGVLKRADKYRHLGHKAAQSRQTQRSQTGNYIAYRKEGHDLHR